MRGKRTELHRREIHHVGEAPSPLSGPFDSILVVFELQGDIGETEKDGLGVLQELIRFVGAYSRALGLGELSLPVQQLAQRAPGARQRCVHRNRGLEIFPGSLQQSRLRRRVRYLSEEVVAQRSTQLEDLGVLWVDVGGALGVDETLADPHSIGLTGSLAQENPHLPG